MPKDIAPNLKPGSLADCFCRTGFNIHFKRSCQWRESTWAWLRRGFRAIAYARFFHRGRPAYPGLIAIHQERNRQVRHDLVLRLPEVAFLAAHAPGVL